MTELAIRRALNELTRKEGVIVAGKLYSLHITHNREAIITDNRDYSKVYAVMSLELYNAMADGSAEVVDEYGAFVARTLAADEPRPFCPFCGSGGVGYCDMVDYESCYGCDEAKDAWYREKERRTQDSLKTEYGYNEDDFAERSGQLDELTVTITLCEYRNLIATQTRLDAEVDRLQEEKADLEKKLQAASEALAACKMPEWIKAIGNVLAHWGEDQGDVGQEALHDGED